MGERCELTVVASGSPQKNQTNQLCAKKKQLKHNRRVTVIKSLKALFKSQLQICLSYFFQT